MTIARSLLSTCALFAAITGLAFTSSSTVPAAAVTYLIFVSTPHRVLLLLLLLLLLLHSTLSSSPHSTPLSPGQEIFLNCTNMDSSISNNNTRCLLHARARR